jgi:hypothetical protein
MRQGQAEDAGELATMGRRINLTGSICKLVYFGGINGKAGKRNSSGITWRSSDCRRLSSGAPDMTLKIMED